MVADACERVGLGVDHFDGNVVVDPDYLFSFHTLGVLSRRITG